MTVKEIFSELLAHKIKGMMIHEQMANYYHFLGLKGFMKCHECHYFEESLSYRDLCSFYIRKYNMLPSHVDIDDPGMIPDSWFKYERQDVDTNTKRTAVKNGMEKWIAWEKDTKELFERSFMQLYELNDITGAMKIKKMLKDVNKEIECAEQESLNLNSVNFDISYIVSQQEELCDKYDREMKNCIYKLEKE